MAKPRTLKTLSKANIEWLTKQKTLQGTKKPGVKAQNIPQEGASKKQLQVAKRQKFFKIREIARKEITDLTFLAEVLPEQQLKQIFVYDQLKSFFSAMFFGEKEKYASTKLILDLSKLDLEDQDQKRERLLGLCNLLIHLIDYPELAVFLAGEDIFKILSSESEVLSGLRAVYYRSVIDRQHQSRASKYFLKEVKTGIMKSQKSIQEMPSEEQKKLHEET